MIKQEGYIEGFARVAVVASALSFAILFFMACTADPEPTPFSLKSPIPIGPYEVTAKRVRRAVDGFTHKVGPGEKGIAVYLSWTGLDAFDRASRYHFIESFNQNRMRILDSLGNTWKPYGTYPVDFYEAPQRNTGLFGSARLRDWVVAFTVPKRARNFTLLIENPDPREGQPRLARVSLGP